VRWEKVAAHCFIESALKINSIESTYQHLCEVFASFSSFGTADVLDPDPEVTVEGLAWALVAYKAQVVGVDVEGIFEESYQDWKLKSEANGVVVEPFSSESSTLPLSFLFSNSSKLRRAFLEMDVNQNLCSIMSSRLGTILSETQAQVFYYPSLS
jgi:hypothetical protein